LEVEVTPGFFSELPGRDAIFKKNGNFGEIFSKNPATLPGNF
jgi:hypothetical protein